VRGWSAKSSIEPPRTDRSNATASSIRGMTSTRYIHIRYPWQAAISRNSRVPSRYFLDLLDHAHRNRLPADRSPRALHSFVARNHLLRGPFAAALRLMRGKSRDDLDRLVRALDERWSEILERSREVGASLPEHPGMLSVLVLERRAARTVFVFGRDSHPILVLKFPRASHDGVNREADALRRAEGLGIAPRFLGWVEGAAVQEALRGEVLPVKPVGDPAALTEPVEHRDVARQLNRMATATATESRPDGLAGPPLEAVLESDLLGPRIRERVREAFNELSSLHICVLKHTDVSPMNCIVDGERLVGFVDWEISSLSGMPTVDLLNAAVCYFEHCFGLTHWSRDELREAFSGAWHGSPYFRFWRRAVDDSVRSLQLPAREHLEVLFFARRIGHRLAQPERFPYGPQTAADLLEVVCAS
jgi:hypothetical protein